MCTVPKRVFLLAALLAAGCAAPHHACDLWIRGGTVVDGTGAPPRPADVLVGGDRIVAVGTFAADRVHAVRVIDAAGRIVAPGFVDAHAHGDPRRTPELASFLAMGVTTVCLGLDGSSPARDLAQWRAEVEQRRPAANVAFLVGHGTVRTAAGTGAAPATAAQRARMAAMVDEALALGAAGLSTGLEYTPGRFADAAELAAVAGPVGARGAVVMSHLRSEDDDAIDGALDELLAQCADAGCAAHVSHLKVVYGHGPARAEAVLARLAAARARGLRVTADLYPYVASYTGIAIVFPPWALAPNDYAEVVRTRRDELAAWLRARVQRRNGPEATLFGSGRFAGRTLAEVAAAAGKPFEDVLIDDIGPDGASAACFVMDAGLMRRLLRDPHVMVASDGSPTMRHPRGHGTFARVIAEHVLEQRLLGLPEAVRKMTSLPAEVLGLEARGFVAAGMAADLVVFDPSAVRDRATFADPLQPAAGFDLVIVNGVVVRDGGRATGARPGRVLARGAR